MSIFQRKLTEVAVDAFTDYLKEKLEIIKQLDLDKDGTKDIDQLADILARLALHFKDVLTDTNFPQIAAGLEQIMGGAEMIRASIDKDRIAALTKEFTAGMKKVGELSKLSIQYVKEHDIT